MAWPTWYPPNCPPSGAGDANGDVYRLVKNSPPQDSDFVPKYLQTGGSGIAPHELCKSSGLSVFADLADVGKAQAIIPGMRKRLVAVGTLNPSHGKLAHTPSTLKSHHTWWVLSGIQPALFFRIIAQESL